MKIPRAATRARLLAPLLGLLACGCTVGPDYHRPELPLARHYTEEIDAARLEAEHRVEPAELPQRWWELYRSPALNDLVRLALANNPSVSAAQAALREALELRRAQDSALYPSLGVGYSASRQRVAGSLATPVASNAYLFNLQTAQLNLSYTPDLFGGNRRLIESLQAQADSQRWALEATDLTLSSNVVVAAITEAGLRSQLEATHRMVALQTDVLARYRRLADLGQNTALDIAQQEAQLASFEAGIPPLEKQLALQRDQIKALCGGLPDAPLAATFALDQLTLPEPLPLTLPSTLVDHRPDVLAAEELLRAASAGIGVAVANRLPTVTLGVDSWGSSAMTLSSLFGAGTGFWNLTGGVAQTVFDAGGLQHREAAARAAYDQAVAQYRSTVINAYQNVADALQAIDADAHGLAAAKRSEDAARRSYEITRRQLALGDASPLALIVAEQSLLQSTLATAQARTNRLADAAALLQALGGGWWNMASPPSGTP